MVEEKDIEEQMEILFKTQLAKEDFQKALPYFLKKFVISVIAGVVVVGGAFPLEVVLGAVLIGCIYNFDAIYYLKNDIVVWRKYPEYFQKSLDDLKRERDTLEYEFNLKQQREMDAKEEWEEPVFSGPTASLFTLDDDSIDVEAEKKLKKVYSSL